MLKRNQFLVSITTTSGSDWQSKIKEIDKLKLKKVALFLTCTDRKERKAMYKLLKKSSVKEVPFVHLRTDMKPKEIGYLVKNFKTKAFNIHSQARHKLFYDYSRYKDMIFVENVWPLFNEKELKQFAGICLDVSHLENDRIMNPEVFQKAGKLIKKYFIGCNHVSGIRKTPYYDKEIDRDVFSFHKFKTLSEFDYLKRYPDEYFSNFIAMELENSIKEQLMAIDYILNL